MNNERILIVGAPGSLSRELVREGYVVQHAPSTRPLWSALGPGAWDACVLDAASIEAEGYDLVRHARETRPELAILVSASDEARSRRLALTSGADASCVPGRRILTAAVALRSAIASRRALLQSRVGGKQGGIVVLDWDALEAPAVRSALAKHGFSVTPAPDPARALDSLRELGAEVLITPPSKIDGVSLVEAALRYDPRLRIIVVSDVADLEGTATAMGQGAHDHLLRPVGAEQAIGAAQAAQLAHASVAPSGETTAQLLNVLLIEAQPLSARLAEEMLFQEGHFEVTHAQDLTEARRWLAQRSFDAILSSLNGERSAALRCLKELRCLDQRTALVLIARGSDPSFLDQAMRMGAEDMISRQRLGREALGARVRAAVQRNHARLAHERFVRDLQTREASHQLMVRSSLDGLCVVDGRGVVVFSNPAAEQMFAGRGGPLLGCAFPSPLGEVGPREIEIGEGSSTRAAELSEVAIDWNGAPAHLVCVRDVTEQRQSQLLRDRLAHSERLAAIGQLAAGVSHEINNPAAYVVANLTSMLDLIADLQNPETPASTRHDKLSELSEMVCENLDGMARIRSITNDLRTFARIDSNEVSAVDLNECVASACKIAFNEIRHRAHLIQELGELPRIRASHGKLAQVVTNLLVNAAQAIPEGDLEAHRITVRTGVSDDEVWLEVQDTGRGIAPEIEAHIFDPFFTTKARSQGTGLGLALCADIVRQHKGTIDAVRRDDGGACFQVRLPRSAELELSGARAAPASSQIVPRREPLAPLRLLLIDDEPLVLRSLKRMLREHHVDAVQGGEAALQHLIGKRDYDLIFCDLMMPEMDGTAVYGELERRMPELCERVVFCSGGAFTPRTKRFVELSSRPLVEKPLTREVFERIAAQHCNEQLRAPAPNGDGGFAASAGVSGSRGAA